MAATSISVVLIDNSNNSTIAIGTDTSLLVALQNMITNATSNSSYVVMFNYSTISTFSATNLSVTVQDYECPVDSLSVHIFRCEAVSPTVPVIDFGTYRLALTQVGNCTTLTCFTQDELNDLYQQALNMCKLCNCNN